MDALATDLEELAKFLWTFRLDEAIRAAHIPIEDCRGVKCAACSGYRAVRYPCVLRVAADRAKHLKL